MKFYENPQINVQLLSADDVLTTSPLIPDLNVANFSDVKEREASKSFNEIFK